MPNSVIITVLTDDPTPTLPLYPKNRGNDKCYSPDKLWRRREGQVVKYIRAQTQLLQWIFALMMEHFRIVPGETSGEGAFIIPLTSEQNVLQKTCTHLSGNYIK